MSYSVADEHRALREAVADLMAKRSSTAQVLELAPASGRSPRAGDSGHDPALWQDLAAMGLLGLIIPEQFGGSGAGPVELGIVMEEMGRALLCAPYLATAVLTPNLLNALGDDDERAAVLPRIAAGELIATVAYAEDSALVPTEPATSARADGAQWRVSGEKTFVLDAVSVGLLYVLAKTDSGPTVFAVEPGSAGVDLAALSVVDPTRKLGRARFTDTPARPVGAPGGGAAAVAAALESSAVGLLAEQAGGAQHAMRMAVEYAKTRYQFGRAIGSFQAVKHLCADMLLEAESTVSAARHVATAFAAEAPTRFADLALAQAYCSEAYVFVAATNIQVHGGIGFTWEHPAHLYLRRARCDAQLFGDPAWHRERYLQRIGA